MQRYVNEIVLVSALIIVLVIGGFWQVNAQSSNGGVIVIPGVASTPAGCAWPSGITVQNGMALCPTSSGLFYALNGSTNFLPVGGSAPTPPVSSVFGRTGSVVQVSGDYSYSQLSSPPTSISCSTASGSTATGLVASGCTIK